MTFLPLFSTPVTASKAIDGFTLIELMVVIAIIGILFSIALPRYQIYTLRANRTDAFSALNETMQAQERYAADNGVYTNDLSDMGYGDADGIVFSPNQFYQIEVKTCTGSSDVTTCVLLVAKALGTQDNDNNGNNGDISLDSRGEKLGW